jgi:hypothetical protein
VKVSKVAQVLTAVTNGVLANLFIRFIFAIAPISPISPFGAAA